MTYNLSYLNLEGEVFSFKIGWFMAILSLIFKRAWQAQFLRHTLVHKTKKAYLFKMYKWYYHHILIFLLVSDLEKSLKSFLSRVQSSLYYRRELKQARCCLLRLLMHFSPCYVLFATISMLWVLTDLFMDLLICIGIAMILAYPWFAVLFYWKNTYSVNQLNN